MKIRKPQPESVAAETNPPGPRLHEPEAPSSPPPQSSSAVDHLDEDDALCRRGAGAHDKAHPVGWPELDTATRVSTICALWSMLPPSLNKDIRDAAKLPSPNFQAIGKELRIAIWKPQSREEIGIVRGIEFQPWRDGLGIKVPEWGLLEIAWDGVAVLLVEDCQQAAASASGCEAPTAPTAPAPLNASPPTAADSRYPSDPTADFLRDLREASSELTRCAAATALAAEEHKEAKAREGVAKARLQMLAANGPEYHPLFDQPPTKQSSPPLDDQPTPAEATTDVPSDRAPQEAEIGQEDDSWRGIPLANIPQFAMSNVTRLHAANILTVGDLVDWTAPNAAGHSKQLTDIEGIGKARAEGIEAAMIGFWAARKVGRG